MNCEEEIKKLFTVIKNLLKRYQRNSEDDCVFSDQQLTETVQRLLANFMKARQGEELYHLKLFLYPFNYTESYGFLDEAFRIGEMIEDIDLYNDGYVFQTYEIVKKESTPEPNPAWNFYNLDVAFRVVRGMHPDSHAAIKVYRSINPNDESKPYIRKQVYPSIRE